MKKESVKVEMTLKEKLLFERVKTFNQSLTTKTIKANIEGKEVNLGQITVTGRKDTKDSSKYITIHFKLFNLSPSLPFATKVELMYNVTSDEFDTVLYREHVLLDPINNTKWYILVENNLGGDVFCGDF